MNIGLFERRYIYIIYFGSPAYVKIILTVIRYRPAFVASLDKESPDNHKYVFHTVVNRERRKLPLNSVCRKCVELKFLNYSAAWWCVPATSSIFRFVTQQRGEVQVQHDEKDHGRTTRRYLRAGRFMKFFSRRRRGSVDPAINNVSPRRHALRERWRYRCSLPHLLLTRTYVIARARVRACVRLRASARVAIYVIAFRTGTPKNWLRHIQSR